MERKRGLRGAQVSPLLGPRRRHLWWLAGLSLVALVLLFHRTAATVSGNPPSKDVSASRESPREAGTAFLSRRTASIQGYVFDPSGDPYSGALVTVAASEERQGDDASGYELSRSDEAGRFRFDQLTPGTYSLTATAVGFGAAVKNGVALAPGQALHDVELTLSEEGLRISGEVRDSGSGPIGGAIVRASRGNTAGSALFATITDGQGKYSLMLSMGKYLLLAGADGYASEEKWLYVSSNRKLDFLLNPAAAVLGRVIARSDSTPVAGALVSLGQTDRQFWQKRRYATSNEGGYFEVKNLDPGEYSISATRGKLVGRTAAPVRVGLADRRTNVLIYVEDGLAITGRVSSSKGHPIGGAKLRLHQFADPLKDNRNATDEKGEFAFEGLWPGRYGLTVAAPEHARVVREVQVTADSNQRVDVVLEPDAQLSGRAISSKGEPVEGASVSAWVRRQDYAGEQAVTSARTTIDGGFLLGGFDVGEYRIEGRHEQYGYASSALFRVEHGEKKEILLTFRDAASISGTVQWSNGVPAAGVSVSVVDLMGPRLETVSSLRGTYKLGPLGEGAARIFASPEPAGTGGQSSRIANRVVELEAGEDKTGIDLILPLADHQIRGVVVDPDGQPVSGAWVDATKGALLGARRKVFSNAEGSFVIHDLPDETFTVSALHPDFPPVQAADVHVDQNVQLQFKRGATISGTVSDAGGDPVKDYTVGLMPRTASPGSPLPGINAVARQLVHDPHGAFSIRNVAADEYDLLVSTSDGGKGAVAGLRISEGQEMANLHVTVTAGATIQGRVVDTSTERPVAGGRVMMLGSLEPTSATIDSVGMFTLHGLAIGAPFRMLVADPERRYAFYSGAIPLAQRERVVDVGTIKLKFEK